MPKYNALPARMGAGSLKMTALFATPNETPDAGKVFKIQENQGKG